MIISLRGTSGSGKSTLTRKVTALYDGDGQPHFIEGRRKAYYTTWTRGTGTPLMVPGHYDIANGGVDTLASLDEAYELAHEFSSRGHDVLMEGKCMSDGTPHAMTLLRRGHDVRIVHINVPVEKCIASVLKRGHNIAPHSIQKTHDKVLRDMQQFRTLGLKNVRQESREECFKIIKWWLAL